MRWLRASRRAAVRLEASPTGRGGPVRRPSQVADGVAPTPADRTMSSTASGHASDTRPGSGLLDPASWCTGWLALATALMLTPSQLVVAEPGSPSSLVWERDARTEGGRNAWRGHQVTKAIAFAADGRTIARLGGEAGSVVVMDAHAGRVLTVHQPNARDWMRFDSHGIGSCICAAGQSGYLVWDGRSKTFETITVDGAIEAGVPGAPPVPERQIEIRGQVLCSAISPSLDRLAVATRDAVEVVSLRDPSQRVLVGERFVQALAYSSDGARLVTARWDGGSDVFRVWDLSDGKLLGSIVIPAKADYTDGTRCIASVPGSSRVVACGWKSGVSLIDTRELQLVTDMTSTSNEVTAIAVSPDGALASVGHRNGDVRFIDIGSIRRHGEQPVNLWARSDDRLPVDALAWRGDSRSVAVALSGGQWRSLRVGGGAVDVGAERVGPPLRLTAVGANEGVVVVGGWGRHAWIRSGGSERVISLPVSEAETITSVACSPLGGRVALGTSVGAVLSSRESGLVERLASMSDPVLAVSVSEDGGRVFAVSARGGVSSWPATSPLSEALSVAGRRLACVGVNPSGHCVVCVDEGDRRMLVLYRRAEGRGGVWSEKAVACPHPIHCCGVSPDGECVAAGDDEYGIVLWEPSSGRPMRRLVGHDRRVNSIAFFPDGVHLVSGGDDFQIRIWDVRTASTVTTLHGNWTAIQSVAVVDAGRGILAGGIGGELCAWRVRSGQATSHGDQEPNGR